MLQILLALIFYINLIFKQVVIVNYHTLNKAIKYVKILYLRFFGINLNIYLETKVFVVCDFILIKLVYSTC